MAEEFTITFLRHGKTGKAENDLDRQLTEEGVAQAHARREALGHPAYDLVLSSPAVRTKHTAALVANVSTEYVQEISTLYMPENEVDRVAIENMFATLLYAPLRDYRKSDRTNALVRYGQVNGQKIIAELLKANLENGAENVLVVGHAVLINAIVAQAQVHGDDDDCILDANLGECEGFKVTINDNGSTAVELIL